ncbi:MAG: 2-dehydro-3-deoxygalactonokinase [Alphaproteobacteria bacterium]|jgi:2-dehydro-3-deoxygalactonokinase
MSFTTPHQVFNPMRDHCYIAIDWGTSRLKAYLCCVGPDDSVEIINETQAAGVQKSHKDFAETFREVTRPWRSSHGLLPVFMGGQIGSSIGWRQSPYVSCPVAPADIVTAQVEFECEGQVINIIPGVSCQHANGHFDVMRSEEIQVLGWLQASATHRNGTYLICLPGTHTKWILVKDGIIQMFKTAMTGELYDLLTHSSILIQAPSKDFTPEAFDLGSKFTLASASGSLIHGLFSVRTKQLFEELSPNEANSYLSGLLIGSDVRAAMHAKEWNIKDVGEVIIIGESHISDLFERVIRDQTKTVRCFHGKQATVLGFAAIRQRYLALQTS